MLLIRGAVGGVLSLVVISSALFAAQGGFGGGHGRFDGALFVLGLPWVLIPWPESMAWSDYLRLVALPFGFNVCTVLGLRFLLTRERAPK